MAVIKSAIINGILFRFNLAPTFTLDGRRILQFILSGWKNNLEWAKRITYHEMGHALVALKSTGTDTVHKISIIPRGIRALDYTLQQPREDRYLRNKLKVLMTNRGIEILVFGNISTGTGDDLGKATDIAKSMVMVYGMEEAFGCMAHDDLKPSLSGQSAGEKLTFVQQYRVVTANHIDQSIRRIVEATFKQAQEHLMVNRWTLEEGAKLLLEKKTLEEGVLKGLATELQSFRLSGVSELGS